MNHRHAWAGMGRGRRYGTSFLPLTALNMRFIAESPFWRGGLTSESATWRSGTATCMSIAGAIVALESVAASDLDASLGAVATMARDSSAGAKPDEAGGSGA